MVAKFSTAVAKIAPNPKGRDFVVGDIHGAFDLVLRAMERARFDQACDRIFSVGDLIDRGPGSHRTAKFLSHSWVHAVRGNHEDMLLEIHESGPPHQAVLDFMGSRNGFRWWLSTPDEVRADILEAVRKLPIAMEVPTPRGLVGFVHADVPAGMSWQQFTAALERSDMKVAEKALWSRDRIGNDDNSGVPGVGRVFVGHTPTALRKLGNVYAIDSGAVFGLLERMEGALTFADIQGGTAIYQNLAEFAPPQDLVQVLLDYPSPSRPFSKP